MFVLWDHGNAFQGAGGDTNCQPSTTPSDSLRMCDWLSLPSILAGECSTPDDERVNGWNLASSLNHKDMQSYMITMSQCKGMVVKVWACGDHRVKIDVMMFGAYMHVHMCMYP